MSAEVVLALAVVLAVATVMGRVMSALGQPAVVGQVLGGIILGPSVLGALPGDPSHVLIPLVVRPTLSQIGNLGVVLYLFLVGLSIDHRVLREHRGRVVSVSLGAFLAPLALGAALAVALHPSHRHVGGHEVALLPFAMLVATAVSITAFPVLARILEERRMQHTEVGILALGAAAVQDLLGWTMLAASLTVLAAGGPSVLATILGELALVLIGLMVVRRVLARLLTRVADPQAAALSVALVGVLLCAAATDAIGLHPVLGAFLFGLALPLDGPQSSALRSQLEPLTLRLLLPVYFLNAGFAFDLSSLSAAAIWQLPAILLVACAGKLGGTMLGARIGRVRSHQTAMLAALMNTRGLIELIVLQVGLSAGVLDRQLFSLFVIMALTTTLMTGPLLTLVQRRAGAGADRYKLAGATTIASSP